MSDNLNDDVKKVLKMVSTNINNNSSTVKQEPVIKKPRVDTYSKSPKMKDAQILHEGYVPPID